MPKKGKKKIIDADFTINDSANAPKPVGRIKKSTITDSVPVKSWEDFDDNDYDMVEEINSDGSKSFVYVKKEEHPQNETDIFLNQGAIYPEIVWHLISLYIHPEDIGNFARINKATYAITKRESFWRALYIKYCKNHPCLPEKLRIENSYVAYGLRQRVIRALYCTYKKLFQRALNATVVDCSPHRLIKRRCTNVWYCKARSNWVIYFKLKRQCARQTLSVDNINFIRELGRIDANPDEDCQVLQVTCLSLNQVPPLMGMALSSVNVSLAQGLMHQRLHLGFNTGICNGSRNIVPESSIVIDSVLSMAIYDWWHPKYPHSDNKLPSIMRDEELLPVLREDFFSQSNPDKHNL